MRWAGIVLFALLFLIGGYNFDAEQAFIYYGEKIVPSNPSIGIFIFLLIMVFIIFTDEILSFFKSSKVKLKEKFK